MLYRLPRLQSRAANAENPLGIQSGGGLAGGGRKGAPCIQNFKAGATHTLLDAKGPGVVRHIWLTFPPSLPHMLRALVLRMYWDACDQPSVEVPIGDFFGIAHARFRPMVSELFSFQNARGLNCWIPMPFQKHARITVENDSEADLPMLFYQIDYTLGDAMDGEDGYFHAQFRRVNCQPIHTDYCILDGLRGRGRYLGTVLGVRAACPVPGWWGEGEVKFYFDGETQPTICGTGAEDYVGFAWGLAEGCTPQQGCALADGALGLYSIYRWHTLDPICFESSLRVTIQQIGFGSEQAARPVLGKDFVRYPAAGLAPDGDMCYYDRSDDFCSVAYWYQQPLAAPFPPLPDRDARLADLSLDKEARKERLDG